MNLAVNCAVKADRAIRCPICQRGRLLNAAEHTDLRSLFHIDESPYELEAYASNHHLDVVCFGHTHNPTYYKKENTIFPFPLSFYIRLWYPYCGVIFYRMLMGTFVLLQEKGDFQ